MRSGKKGRLGEWIVRVVKVAQADSDEAEALVRAEVDTVAQ